MTKKQLYETPEAEVLVVKIERGFLEVSGGVNYANTSGGAGGDDNYDDGEGF